MDFAALKIGSEAAAPTADTIHDFTPIDPATVDENGEGGEPCQNGAGEPLVLKIADPASPRARREMVKLRIRWPHVVPEGDEWTEAELERAAVNEEGRKRYMLARFVTGWNLQNGADGDPVEFNVENGAQFFECYPNVEAATMAEIVRLREASGNGQSGFAGGPRKKAGSRASSRTPAKRGGKP